MKARKQGYTMEDIAKAARVSLRTVYIHRDEGILDLNSVESVSKYVISGILWSEIFKKEMPSGKPSQDDGAEPGELQS